MEKFYKNGHLAKHGKRWLALLMSVCLIGTMIPVTARAETAENIGTNENLTKQTTNKLITTWQWMDEDEYLDEETGSLSLPGASEEMPAYFDDVISFLPTKILATVENAVEPITFGEWECDNYPKDGAYTGSYTFTAALPEGYELSEEAEALTVLVELGGATLLSAVSGITYLTCDSGGKNWTTENCNSATEVTSEDTAWGTSATDTWYVVNGTMTIGSSPSKVRISVSGNVHLILTDGCSLTIKGGIEVADGNSLTIYGQTGDTGALYIQNVESGKAGIGSASNTKCGTIKINGGIVTAEGGFGSNDGAGIGSGYQGEGGTITINGGTVTATGYGYGAGIGGGSKKSGGTITINGGTVTATGGSSGGAGIGGGEWGDGGSITINGGTITATGGTNGGAGIGDGENGSGGTVAISNSFVMAGSISDTSSQESWNGLIFVGEAGKVYGESFTVSTDCTIPSGKTLVVVAEQTISITETKTLTNEGTIYNSGTITGTVTNSGTIHNAGSISGASGGTINQYSISIEQIENSCQSATLTLKVNDTTFEETVIYTLSDGETYAVIENGNTLKVVDSGFGIPIPVTATFTVDGVSMTRTEDVTITGHAYGNNGFCTECDAYEPATLTTDKYDIDGDDANDNVYEIGNAGQLYWFAALVNGTNGLTQNRGANAVLTDNITVNTGDVANCGGKKQAGWKDWTPIVGSSYPNYYAGTFDGQNHTVSGLYFNDSNVDKVGLFGITGSSSKISNVGVVDSYFRGNERVGGVCGGKNGTMENCYSASTVSGTGSVGGVCGDNSGSSQLINCYNTGTVNCSVRDGLYIGGVCGISNSGTIQNCYSTGTVSGSHTSVGGVCGQNQGTTATISNCYFDSNKCDKNAVGTITNGTVEKTEGKTAAQFASGEVAYLLNTGKTDGSQVWYQTLETEPYPNLNSTNSENRTVYVSAPCPSEFSNTSGQVVAHIFEKIDDTNHKCKVCGLETGHSTETLTYTADEDTNEITVKCGDGCGKEYGTVILSAPTEDLIYDGNEKTASVINKVTGVTISEPTFTYKKGGVKLSSAPKDAGTYTASITLGEDDGAKTVSVTYEITKAAAGVGTAPSAGTGLTYNGNPKELVTEGSATSGTGTLQYSTSKNGAYSTNIPTGTDAQQYSVWYKVVGDANHSDTTPVEIKVTIAPLTITNENTTINLGTPLTYTGAEQTQSIASVTVGTMTLGAGDYTVSGNKGTNAGNYTLTVTGTGNFTGAATKTFSISKKSLIGTKQTLLVKKNQEKDVTYDLSKLLPEGVTGTTTYAVGNVTNGNGVLSPAPTTGDITNGKLILHIASVDSAGKTATVPITFTNSNYDISVATLTVKTTDKTPVTLSGVTCGNPVYNGTSYAYSGTPVWKTEEGEIAAGETTVTYYKADNTPLESAPTNAGNYRAVFTITSDEYVGTASYSFEITKAEITVAAKDRNIYTGDTVPDLTNPTVGTDYTVTGLYGTDAVSGTAIMSYGQTPDNTKAGTYEILISGLTAPEGDNYTITFAKGTLKITTKPSGGGGSSSGGSSGGGSSGGESSSGDSSGGSDNTGGSEVTTGKDSESNAATTTSPTDVKVENGTASATVKAENVTEAIKQAADSKSAEIVFAVSEKDTGNADNIQLTMTTSDVKQILDKTDADLVVATTAGDVILPQEALKEAVSAAGGNDITIEIGKVTTPTAAQKEAAGENSYIVEVTISSQNEAITTFGGNTLKIRLEIPAALAGKDVAVIHIAADGKTEKMPGKMIQEGTKQYYEFTTTHLSTFALVDSSIIEEPEKPSDPTTPEVTVPKKGTLLTDSKTKMVYKVTKSGTTGGTIQFVKTRNTKTKTVAIPDKVTIDGITYKVTSIAANALKNNKTVTTVTIGKDVTSIGSGAFSGCSKLKKVTIGKSVTTIGSKAFYKCTSLTGITIPSKVTKIGDYVFKGCTKLKTINLNTTLLTTKTVSGKAFSGVSTSAVVKVPKSKLESYKKLFVKKGLSKKVKVKKK